MKKAINKAEREHILQELVVHACAETSKKIVSELRKLRGELHKKLLNHWEHTLPGISREDQLKLIRERATNTLHFKPNMFATNDKDKVVCTGDFGCLAWSNNGMADNLKQRLSQMASKILRTAPNAREVVVDGVSTSWQSNLSLSLTFADIITGFQPTQIYRTGAEPEGVPSPPYHNGLLQIHDRVEIQLKKLKDLLFSAEDMYQELSGVIAPLKTAQALAEAMPEAVKHFPESLTYVKPTKEIADPKAIIEIRAKLKKGLPI